MATVNAVLVTSRKDKKGRSTIKIAVQHENKRKLFSLTGGNFKATEDEWDDQQRLYKHDRTDVERINALNKEILSQQQNIIEIIGQYEKSRLPWSLQMLSERLDKKPKTALFHEMVTKYVKTISDNNADTGRVYKSYTQSIINHCAIKNGLANDIKACEKINKPIKEKNRQIAIENKRRRNANKPEKQYELLIGEKEYKKLTCSDINYEFVKNYKNEMLIRKDGKGLEYRTIKSRLVFIKTVLNEAIREKVASPETFPFSKRANGKYIKLSELKSTKTHRSLPETYLDQILAYRAYHENDIHWQIFIFAKSHPCLEFLNVIQLKDTEFILDTDRYGRSGSGIKVRSAQQRKTEFVYFTPLMLRIIDDMKANYQLDHNRLFPVLTKETYSEKELIKIKKSHNHSVAYCKKYLTLNYNSKKQYNDQELSSFADQRFYNYGDKLALLLWRFSHSMDGINMLDMIKLKKQNIDTNLDKDGELVRLIRYKRSKTNEEITTSISEDAELIIDFFEKYQHFFPTAKDYLLPILTQEDADDSDNLSEMIYKRRNTILNLVNRRMKMIGLKMGWPKEISEQLSFYWARHTFAQRALLKGASLERIQNHLGHRDIKTTEVYVSGFDVLNKAAFKKQMFENDRPAI